MSHLFGTCRLIGSSVGVCVHVACDNTIGDLFLIFPWNKEEKVAVIRRVFYSQFCDQGLMPKKGVLVIPLGSAFCWAYWSFFGCQILIYMSPLNVQFRRFSNPQRNTYSVGGLWCPEISFEESFWWRISIPTDVGFRWDWILGRFPSVHAHKTYKTSRLWSKLTRTQALLAWLCSWTVSAAPSFGTLQRCHR